MEKQDVNHQMISTTTRDRGDSLEKAIEYIFNTAGFNTKRGTFITKYEIDVLAEIGDRKIIIECKNYQNSNLTIRNIIHQWNSKNEIIQAHKIIIALAGLKIKESDYELANQFDIELWSQDDITELFTLSLKPKELRTKLIKKIDFKPITIEQRYRNEITYLIIKPLLSRLTISEEELYTIFNNWLRAHILTELEMSETTVEQRRKFIELFEGTKVKKGFFNLVSYKRSSLEYWDTVYDKLSSSNVLPKEQQEYFLRHMDGLLNEYSSQTDFFKTDEKNLKLKKLISSRLRNAMITNQDCKFKTSTMNASVNIEFNGHNENSVSSITINGISKSESNILNWIMTSQSYEVYDHQKQGVVSFSWNCSSLSETADKVFRLFTEYYNVDQNSELLDLNIT